MPVNSLKSRSLLELLEHHADQPGEGTSRYDFAYAFSEDGLTLTHTLTWHELMERVFSLAVHLQANRAIGERVLLVYPPGLDFVVALWACFAAGAVAVPCPTPNPYKMEASLRRLHAVAADSQACLLLTTTAILEASAGIFTSQALTMLASDSLPHLRARPEPTDTPDVLLQYTSGSTQTPRGVCISQANLLHNLEQIYRRFGHQRDSLAVIWLPHYHDMGLIGGILQPAYGGFPVILMPPYIFLQHPFRWLKIISDFGGTTSGGPNFAYDLCVRKISPAQRDQLDLRSWKVAFNGAEPIQAATLERFTQTFRPAGFHPDSFYPCYGLAENTLIASGDWAQDPIKPLTVSAAALHDHRVRPAMDEEASQTLIGCGSTLDEQQIRIVDPDTYQVCAADRIGEIWITGASVASGYWQQPDITVELLAATIQGEDETPYLRTGDLGFLHEGQLFITGRLKELLILDGVNYYPQDMEIAIEQAHPAIKQGGSFVFQVDDRVIALVEVSTRTAPVSSETIIKSIRQAVAQTIGLSLQDVVLVNRHSLPKTSSGKRQRYLARTLYLENQLDLWTA